MAIFPTQYSTLSAVALKDFLSEKYGLDAINCKLLIHNVSDTYLLETARDKYIFKTTEMRTVSLKRSRPR
ncbi:hypothetical protein [Pedobacter sp. UC225_65]|uniref:hypothetical protein n=1 Tax=Pedobacter sp. UC225_65 TaxID=3350173 RepID=UPI003671F987